ncbi:TIGR02301 family protein [Methylocapsa sp. S129]|uniref:TIGR02301 family protein n=1 Tax=Methylocapsa sp. S129 TaxID=1641869 RepID=UPI00157773B9|nr:TIGR02301 family protein [Methylocapsa sp. S129]
MSARLLRLAVVAALCAAVAGPACAQQAPAKPAAPAEPPAPAADPPPPYEPQLLRLAELMGALAYLRDLCGAHDAEAFHAKMANLLEAEAKSEARKESLAGAYNDGFRGYELSYRVCTPAAREIIARYLDEAAKISSDVANRYGG